MANCLKCPHIDRLRAACIDCPIGKDGHKGNPLGCGISNKGITYISLDAARDENCRDRMLAHPLRPQYPEVVETPLNPKERENLLRVLCMFGSLSYDEAGLVCRMMAGASVTEIAQERGISEQTVYSRWLAVTKRDPSWKALASGMIGSGRGRKAGQRQRVQMSLFDSVTVRDGESYTKKEVVKYGKRKA